MTGMTDQTLVNTLLTNLYKTSTATAFTPGTGGTAFSITLPYRLHLMTAVGTESTAGTEMSTGSGYTAGFNASGGSSLGAVFAGTVATGSFSNANAVSWTATGTWSTVTSIEIYDSASTAVRHLWGTLTASITGVVNGDTVQFAAASITVNASTW
jgi:hypothetical protein